MSKNLFQSLLPAIVFCLALTTGSSFGQEPVSDSLRTEFELDPFYKKVIFVGEFPVLGSDKVSDAAMAEAAWIVRQMTTHRPELLTALAESRTRLAVMAHNEYTTDIPEHSKLESRVYWDRRARGLGATPSAPAVSCAEENLLCLDGDPYWNENICIHEFAHALHGMAMRRLDRTFDLRLKKAYRLATENGLWAGTYAGTNAEEYFAEGTQSWFDDNRENDALHNQVNTRAELLEYDPALAELCNEVYGDREWRYLKPGKRSADDRAHLGEFPVPNAPRFRWRAEPIPDRPVVLIQTAIGDIELELNAQAAPNTVANFLHYVHEGLYADGEFFRTVRMDNQTGSEFLIEIIQGSANQAKRSEFPDPIKMERTSDTELKHLSGTISMARDKPDSAQDHFFICISDQPELDFGGRRNPDGQGFAAFGKVINGMDIVRKIHQSKTDSESQTLSTPIRIQRAIRKN
jgi:cyclophilin family peptidyl-prolyl cis-trans isomerase